MFASDPDLNFKMKQLGERLNLSKHHVCMTELYGPGDIEGHLGHDGRHYLLDFSRILPPEAPSHSRPDQRSIYFNLLRPKIVLDFQQSLCR